MGEIENAIQGIRLAIAILKAEGNELHEGPLCDLANIFNKIIRDYQKKGIDFVVDQYWFGKDRVNLKPKASFLLLPRDPINGDEKIEIIIGRQSLNTLSRHIGNSFLLEGLYGTASAQGAAVSHRKRIVKR